MSATGLLAKTARLPTACLGDQSRSRQSSESVWHQYSGLRMVQAAPLSQARGSFLNVDKVSGIRSATDGVEVSLKERETKPVTSSLELAAQAAEALASEQRGTANVNGAHIMDLDSKLFVGTYARAPVVFTHGKGSKLYDTEGKEYIDMAGGIAVNALGHADEAWVNAVATQASLLAHVSNLYHTIPQVQLAERLVKACFADRIFFANSGTEANEAAIKFARKYQRDLAARGGAASSWLPWQSPEVPVEFVAFTGGFHGRTLGSLALTHKIQYRAPFEPIMPGAKFATYGNLESAAQVIKKGKTAAVFVEPVQGEGGVFPSTKAFLQGLRNLCDEAGALLIFDEIQCGLGRTGRLFAHEAYGVLPDMMTLAKPLAGGLPIGAVMVTEAVAKAVSPGDHGSTFAGGPLVCNAALAVLDRLQEPGFIENVASKGELLKDRLKEKLGGNPHFQEVRGLGLLVGLQLDVPAGPLVDAARKAGLLVITAGKGDVVRFAPPLVITEVEIDAAVDILAGCMSVLE